LIILPKPHSNLEKQPPPSPQTDIDEVEPGQRAASPPETALTEGTAQELESAAQYPQHSHVPPAMAAVYRKLRPGAAGAAAPAVAADQVAPASWKAPADWTPFDPFESLSKQEQEDDAVCVCVCVSECVCVCCVCESE
jgi:hypothetical protein